MSNRYIVRNTVYLLGIIGVLLITACNDTKKTTNTSRITNTEYSINDGNKATVQPTLYAI